jgi:hypothetical protein
MFLGLQDPDLSLFVGCMDPDPSIIKQKKVKKISISTLLLLLYDFSSLKTDVNVPIFKK